MQIISTTPHMPKYQPDELVFGVAKGLLRQQPWTICTHPDGPFIGIRDLIKQLVPDGECAKRYTRHCGIEMDV